MPHIGGVYLGEDYADDAIIYPHHAGERTRNPVMGYGVIIYLVHKHVGKRYFHHRNPF